MRSSVPFRLLLATCALIAAIVTVDPGLAPPRDALAADKVSGAASAGGRPVSYLKEIRPILAQHCFRCHGPDEAARKGKLRLDLQPQAFAARGGKHVIAPGRPAGSLVWERVTAADNGEWMPPAEAAQPLTDKQIATLKSWI